MPSFNAKDAVEPLTYDFRPHADVSGEVPEPTDDQVAEFYGDLANQLTRALPEKVDGVDVTDPYELSKVLITLDGDDHRKLYDALLDLHAAVCGNSPSREDVEKLPYRLRRAWYGMVQGWLRPEASRPATND